MGGSRSDRRLHCPGPPAPCSAVPWLAVVNAGIVVAVLLLNLLQQPGRITFDTKLDLQLDPADLLARSLHLWNGDWALGGLQNQASGYLFPMGPVFLAGDLLGVPMWIWERLWSAAVMLLAYEGTRRLASRWPGIGAAGAVLAGLTYMLAPRVLTTVGGLSGETLPAAVLPWTVLPLVLYLRGRLRGWVAFVLSAATIPWMGGQNATLVVACLVLPGAAARVRVGADSPSTSGRPDGMDRSRVVATLWWVVPLLLLGSYAPPFLDFIESADNTAGATGWLASLRGTSHWVAFFPGGGPRLGRGYELASSTVLLVPDRARRGARARSACCSRAVGASGARGVGARGSRRADGRERRLGRLGVLRGVAAGPGLRAGAAAERPQVRPPRAAPAQPRPGGVRHPACPGPGGAPPPPRLSRPGASRSPPPRSWCLPRRPGRRRSLRTAGGFDDVSASWREAVAYLGAQPGPSRSSCCRVPASPCRPGAAPSTSRSRCSTPRRGWRARRSRSRRPAPSACSTPSSRPVADRRPHVGSPRRSRPSA